MTTNQTKQFCGHNPYFLHYRNYNDQDNRECLVLPERYCRKYKKDAGYICPNGYKTSHLDYNHNSNYHYAWKEFERKFPHLERNIRVEYSATDISGLRWSAYCKMHTDGRWYMYIHSCRVDDDKYYNYPYPFVGEQIHFEHMGILDAEHMADGLRKYIDKFLFPKGKFRYMQLLNHWEKRTVVHAYRNYVKKREWAYWDVFEHEATVSKWIIKHYNVDISGVDFEDGVTWVNKHGKQKCPIKLGIFNYSFVDYIDGDIDEVEQAFWEEIDNYPKNMVFIN